MNENPNRRPDIPAGVVVQYRHKDGTECEYRPYWVGNIRDGHWEFGYWVWNGHGWRYCGEHN